MSIFGFRLYFQSLIKITPLNFLWLATTFTLIAGAILLIVRQKNNSPLILKILRIAAILAFYFFIILEPIIVKVDGKQTRDKKPTLSILLDFSRSMVVTKRIEKSLRWLESNLKYLAQDFDIRIFTFARSIKELPTEKFFNIKNLARDNPHRFGDENATDITGAISGAAEYARKKGLARESSILLVSDGLDTLGRVEAAGGVVAAKGEFLPPVFVPDIFSDERREDISIVSINAPPYAFKGIKIPISIVLRKKGSSAARSLPVNVSIKVKHAPAGRRKDNGISTGDSVTETIIERTLAEGDNEIKFTLPREAKTGKITYSLKVSSFNWEITGENNEREFSIEILRDKIRVLYLCGRPSYEYSFLRDFIKNDLGFELVTFVILRNPEDVALVPDEELSLIPFPGADLIVRQLKDFDVVIFENFTYQRFGIYHQHLDMIKKWVGDGGGFFMIAGENSFSRGGYDRTAITEILPVKIESGEQPQIESGLFVPVIARRGMADDFIFQWLNPDGSYADGNLSSVQLPPLDWIEKLKPSADAVVPLFHPWSKFDNNIAAPVLAFKSYGKGRSGALLTNSTWRWKMSSVDGASGLYEGFWKAVLSYLSSSGQEENADGQLRVIGFKKKIGLYQSCDFIVKKRYPSSRLSVIVTEPDGSKKAIEPAPVAFPGSITERKNMSDYVMFSVKPSGGRGVYFFELSDESHHHSPRVKRETLQMTVVGDYDYYEESNVQEITELEPDKDYLKLLARQTGGAYLDGASIGGTAISEEIKKIMLSKNRGSFFATTPDSAGEENESDGHRGWRPSKEPSLVIFALLVLITAELILRRRRYGLW